MRRRGKEQRGNDATDSCAELLHANISSQCQQNMYLCFTLKSVNSFQRACSEFVCRIVPSAERILRRTLTDRKGSKVKVEYTSRFVYLDVSCVLLIRPWMLSVRSALCTSITF